MSRRPSVAPELLRLVIGFGAHLGVDAAQALAAAGLEPGDVETGGRVPLATFSRVFDALAEASHQPTFGLQLGAAAPQLSSGHVVFVVMKNSATVAAALERLFRYHALLTDALSPAARPDPAGTALTLERRGSAPLNRHHVEAVMAMLATALRQLSARRIAPVSVHFRHTPPAGTADYQRIFEAPVRFGQARDAMLVSPQDLAAEVLLPNAELLASLDRFATTLLSRLEDDESWAGRVTRAVAAELGRGRRPLVGAVAFGLGIGARQLQHHLRSEGTSFRRAVDTVSRDLAVGHLEAGDLSLCELAFLLGFSEQTAFNHAFKRWTGRTPSDFRR